MVSTMASKDRYDCSICSCSYAHQKHLKEHEDSIHKGIKYSCQDCGKQFKRKTHLTAHNIFTPFMNTLYMSE